MTRITALFPLWALLGALIAYAMPDWLIGLKPAIVPLLGLVMFGMGVTLTLEQFAGVLRRPGIIALGLALQYGVMPLAGWLIGLAFGLPPALLVGFVLLGACPGGTASNVVCYLARGDVALSITLTTASTLVAVLLTPALTWLYVGQRVPVPALDMLISIGEIILAPVALGVLANHLLGRWLAPVKNLFPLLSVGVIVLIISIIVALNHANLAHVGPLVALAVVLHNSVGLIAGYWGARLLWSGRGEGAHPGDRGRHAELRSGGGAGGQILLRGGGPARRALLDLAQPLGRRAGGLVVTARACADEPRSTEMRFSGHRPMPRAGFSSLRLLPLLVLSAGLIVAYASWRNAYEDARRHRELEFEVRAAETLDAIQDRLSRYEEILLGAAGIFNASETVERDEFRDYVDSLDVQRRYPGIQGVGFARWIPAPEKAAHLERMRREGFPSYRIWPEDPRETWTSILYLEPFDARNRRAFGYDMYTEPVRRAAMERARDRGEMAISGQVTLVQETERDVQAGFLMYVPLYAKHAPHATLTERRQALQGWVYAPFRMRDLMDGILRDHYEDIGRSMSLEIYDGDAPANAAILFDSHVDRTNARASFRVERAIEIGGRHWFVAMRSLPGFNARQPSERAKYLAILGGVGTFALTLVVWLLVNGRERARRMAGMLTRELSDSEARYRQAFEINSAIKLMVDPESGHIVEANSAAVEFYGYPRERLLALRIMDINPLAAASIVHEMTQAVSGAKRYFQFKHRLASGDLREVEVYSGPVIVGGRTLLHSIIHDITDRRRVEAALLASETMLRTIYDLLPIGISITDPSGSYRRLQPRFGNPARHYAGRTSPAGLRRQGMGDHSTERFADARERIRQRARHGRATDGARRGDGHCPPAGNHLGLGQRHARRPPRLRGGHRLCGCHPAPAGGEGSGSLQDDCRILGRSHRDQRSAGRHPLHQSRARSVIRVFAGRGARAELS